MPIKLTLEDFVRRSNIAHKNKYDYTNSIYVNSSTKVLIGCPVHGAFEQLAGDHIRGRGCAKCSAVKQKDTCMERYGVSSATKLEWCREKKQQTCIERYGVNNPSLVSDFKVKRRNTFEARYGVSNASQVAEFNNKRNVTFEKHYGCHPRQTAEVQKKYKLTCLEKYGVDNPRKSKRVICNTVKNTHGKDISKAFKLLDDPDWLREEYVQQGKSLMQIATDIGTSQTTVGKYLKQHGIDVTYTRNFSSKSISWLNSVMENDHIFIQHALNVGEYNIPGTRLKADGFCFETNTIYEFYGDFWHGNPTLFAANDINAVNQISMGELFEKTCEKEQVIKQLGYNLIIMWERDFDELRGW